MNPTGSYTWRYLPLLSILLLAVGSTGGFAQVVNFPDSNLEAAIREAINEPSGDIYASDLWVLTEFDAAGRSIANLSGLEYCTNLTVLRLDDNQSSDAAQGPPNGLSMWRSMPKPPRQPRRHRKGPEIARGGGSECHQP